MLAIKILLIFLEVVLSALLIVVILLQRSKGEGLGLAFGAEMGESLFGARASSALVKITIWLGIIFTINTIILARIYTKSTSSSLLESHTSTPIEQPVMPPASPALPATPISAPVVPSAPAPAAPVPMAPVTVPQDAPPQAAPVAQ